MCCELEDNEWIRIMKNENKIQKSSQDFILQIKSIISTAQQNVVKSVNQERVLMYWKIGERFANIRGFKNL